MFRSDGVVDEVDLDTQQVTTIGQIWEPIAPQFWAAAKVWRPRWVGHTVGETGGVLFGSPQGLYAYDGQTLFPPGSNAPDWLTNLDPAAGDPQLQMPFGLPGIYAMEVWQERLWVAGKDVISFSAPSNGADFSTVDGGGSFGYFGDRLTYSYMDLAATAGYLYVFGDSSTDIISNIQISSTNIGTSQIPILQFTTNFNYANLDPQVGHGFPRPAGRWGRYFVLMNGDPRNAGATNPQAYRGGIYLMYGGDAQLIGERVSNVYVTLDTSQYLPTLAPATMFGFRVMLLNGRFTDPFGRTRSLLLMWHGSTRGKSIWSIAAQNLELTHIMSWEQDSVITPYGTDGKSLYRLFDHPDPALPKRLATKAYRGKDKSSLAIKNFKRVYLELHDELGGGTSLTGDLTTHGGGIPNGKQDISFELVPGEKHNVIPYPVSGAGLSGAVNLQSISPDFTIERLQVASEDRTLYGA